MKNKSLLGFDEKAAAQAALLLRAKSLWKTRHAHKMIKDDLRSSLSALRFFRNAYSIQGHTLTSLINSNLN